MGEQIGAVLIKGWTTTSSDRQHCSFEQWPIAIDSQSVNVTIIAYLAPPESASA
jgi:hypothetical protein